MNEIIEVGDQVRANIPGDTDEALYIVTGIDPEGKNGQPVLDLRDEAGCARLQYVSRVELVAKNVEPDPIAGTPLLADDGIDAADLPNAGDVPRIRFRATRENLKLSRKDVQDATGLSASVVWRAEQENKTVKDEDAAKIWLFLSTAQPKVGTSAKPKPTVSQAIMNDLIEVQALASKLAIKIELTREMLEAAIAAAKEAKRSSKDLQAILEQLEA